MAFPYERYATLNGPLTAYYPAHQAELAQRIVHEIAQASQLLSELLNQPSPPLEILIATPTDWPLVPQESEEEEGAEAAPMLPYWTAVTSPSTLVVPEKMDEIIGEATPEKLSLLLYHELAHAFLESDPRPWPEELPLWADEWQLQFAAFWLFWQIHGQVENITADLREQFAELFEPEADGKTPVTVRGFDWYEDTTPDDYLEFVLLLERFASDLLTHYDATILPRFLTQYRRDLPVLLSDEATLMLAEALGPGGEEWLENLVYF
ncbi:MAG: hypothetical protein ACRDHZ_16240 [Ktedonobacteraceae bacterium]